MATDVGDFNFKDAVLGKIPLSKIRENSEALRKKVDKQKTEYKELVDSVRKRGIMNPILVREVEDPQTKEKVYGLIDGLHRFNAAMDAGLTEIPANIGSLGEANLIEAQILANVQRIETKPVEYTKGLLVILGQNPLLSLTELAARLSKSDTWLKDRLQLVKLSEQAQGLVDGGQLGLSNAYALARLPEERQAELLDQAIGKSPAEFVPHATNILKEIQKAKREGREANPDTFTPVARAQRVPVVRDELSLVEAGSNESKVLLLLKEHMPANAKVEDVAKLCLQWFLHLDPVSVALDEQKWKQNKIDQKNKKEEDKKKRDAEKLQKARELLENAGQPVTA
jgi:ParB/RepB/Spo0J family partition protein